MQEGTLESHMYNSHSIWSVGQKIKAIEKRLLIFSYSGMKCEHIIKNVPAMAQRIFVCHSSLWTEYCQNSMQEIVKYHWSSRWNCRNNDSKYSEEDC